MTARVTALVILVLGLLAPAARAQTVGGTVFEDRDADGIHDAGEPALSGFEVELWGQSDGTGAVDALVTSAADGSFSFSPGNGCYVLRVRDPAGWRLSASRSDGFPPGTPGYTYPVGQPRFSKLDQGIDHLRAGSLEFAALGDSIAWNWNSCFFSSQFWYSNQVRSRLACTTPGASIPLYEDAVKGEHTDDLMVDESNDFNNVFRAIDRQPELVTISIIGNDLLGVDPGSNPTQAETNRAVEEVLDARQNLQEVLSSLIAGIPGADVALNTLYDNETYNCDSVPTSDFHREWLPIVNRMLRELAWGQARRVSINEARAEFAREDLLGACTGFEGLICRDIFGTDNIHPDNDGYTVLREKVWEAVGGVNLGSRDALGRTSIDEVGYGYLRRVRRLLPATWETRDGAAVVDPAAAFDDADGGAAASITLGSGSEEVRFTGFPDWYDEIAIVKVIAGVRYTTAGAVADDFYRIEASLDETFRPGPGYDYTTTNWNFYTPIVGAGGPNKPDGDPDYGNAELLVVPDVVAPREATATLTGNPVLAPGGADYDWPPPGHADLATTTVRVAAAPVAATPGNDAYTVELDAAWLDLYGWEKPRPGEVTGLRVDRAPDGSLEVSFDELAGAQRYNLYFGRLAALGAYDHGAGAPAGPRCAAATEAAGPGRLRIVVAPEDQPTEAAYVVVTGHVDDVESPTGFRSAGAERDRSQSTCR